MKRGQFIVIEALDGVGKTTLVRALAASLNAVALATPGAALAPHRSAILAALGDHQLARALFYAASVLAVGAQAQALAQAGETVVVDRYWLSTLAYARARGVRTDLGAIQDEVPSPDVTVLLTLDENVRRQRLNERGALSPADEETLCPVFRARVLGEMRRAGAGALVEIDVTGLNRAEVVRRVKTRIEGLSIGSVLEHPENLFGV